MVFITPLRPRSRSHFFQPLVSQAPVTLASFHPQRPNVFLLGFKDGSLAAYDASQMLTTKKSRWGAEVEFNPLNGQIGFFERLHAVTTHGARDPEGWLDVACLGGYDPGTKTVAAGARTSSITGAEFTPGHRWRAASTGSDGWCHILDFDNPDSRKSWHVKSGGTALSILSRQTNNTLLGSAGNVPEKSIQRRSRKTNVAPGITLAIGRVDGRVLLFDCSGSLMQEIVVDESDRRVIGLEWVAGPKPQPLGNSQRIKLGGHVAWVDFYTVGGTLRARTTLARSDAVQSSHCDINCGKREGAPNLDTQLASTVLVAAVPEPPVSGELGTVRRQQVKGPIQRDLPKIRANEDAADLFSPPTSPPKLPPRELPASPLFRKTSNHPRARVTSSTFRRTGKKEMNSAASRSTPEEDSILKYDSPRSSSSVNWSYLDVSERSDEQASSRSSTPGSTSSIERSTSFADDSSVYSDLGSLSTRSPSLFSYSHSETPLESMISPGRISQATPSSILSSVSSAYTQTHSSVSLVSSGEPGTGRERFYSAVEYLPPGFAQSFYGPVEVEQYIPRRSSRSTTSTRTEQ